MRTSTRERTTHDLKKENVRLRSGTKGQLQMRMETVGMSQAREVELEGEAKEIFEPRKTDYSIDRCP